MLLERGARALQLLLGARECDLGAGELVAARTGAGAVVEDGLDAPAVLAQQAIDHRQALFDLLESRRAPATSSPLCASSP